MRLVLLAAAALIAAAAPASAATFGPASPLIGFDRADVALAADARGDALLLGTRPQRDTVLLVERPAGAAFGPVVVLRDGARSPDQVAAAAAGDGAAALAWREGGRQVLVAVREPGGALGAPRALNAGRAERPPRVAVAADGSTLVTFLEGGRVKAAFRPAGEDFGPVRTLSGTGASAARVAMTPQGDAVVGWARRPVVEAVAVRRGGRFGRVTTVGRTELDGRLAVGIGPRRAVVAWLEQRRSTRGARVEAVVREGGRFGAERLVARTGSRELVPGAPVAAVDAAGSPVVAYAVEGPAPRARGRVAQVVVARPLSPALTRVGPPSPDRLEPASLVALPGGGVAVGWTEGLSSRRLPGAWVAEGRGRRFGPARLLEQRAPASTVVLAEGPLLAAGPDELVAVWSLGLEGGSRPDVRWAVAR